LNDKNFNIKIANKKEFNNTKYDGTIYGDIKKQSDILAKADYELSPHQAFVKNFMSFQTPYSSLLLYHGLGSGKTCSAIGVCEEMRDYMKQTGITKRMIIVASENVQDNFKLQLFDERKLKEVNGIWTMRGCIGNKLLKEINPMNMPMSKEKIINQVKILINTYYIFLGYIQFANYIIKTMNYEEEMKKKFDKKKVHSEKREKTKIETLKDIKVELNSRVIRRLRNEFDSRLIVIDEVHNIRKTEDNDNKKVAINLEFLVKAAQNMRFLLLSATPMYNNYKEIIWLLNLMNTNDKRGRIEVKDIFDNNGNFKKNGEELLIRKATGYISFIRGENPYTFPYRVYPNEFAPKHTFSTIKYPSYQMNLKKIKHEDKKRILNLYLNKIGECDNCGKCQYCCYKYIIYNLRNKKFSITTKQGVIRELPNFNQMESFGYTLLQTPLESLIISYPVPGLKDILDELPPDKLSKEFSPSFDEFSSEEKDKDEDEDEDEDESPEPIIEKKKPLLIVESTSSARKSSDDDDINIPNISKPETTKTSSSEEYILPKKQSSIPKKDTPIFNLTKIPTSSSKETSIQNEKKNEERKEDEGDEDINIPNISKPETTKTSSSEEYILPKKQSSIPKKNTPIFNLTKIPTSSSKETSIQNEKKNEERKEDEEKEEDENEKILSLSDFSDLSRSNLTKIPTRSSKGTSIQNEKKNEERKYDEEKEEDENEKILSLSDFSDLSRSNLTKIPTRSSKGTSIQNEEKEERKYDEEKEEDENEKILSLSDFSDLSRSNLTKIPTSSSKGTSIGGTSSSTKHSSSSSSSSNGIYSIDPHQLTGKIGLERMMTFLDSKSPPIKGEFEYKSTTIKNYGKIFSQKEIGNYSSKIKSILDKIYNQETNHISDGIILIYSQYIDSGLIPVALALEEMGFTRFGQTGIKPLFKSRPTEVVDVRTMKPSTDKKDFKPARYSMITGDPRLSPNNDFEVKNLTGEDNKDGNKIKVVLISKAGSEGIDFKYIRQVHILEPWYNMNRIEQIIGRAVRNYSHSLLPFEKRNVEIYMYGTILDKNIEESADLYVYRVAEYKALQIGKVTRVLKETAIDCIINHEQTNFTQEIMSANLNEPIVQELSTGLVLNDFKIGDAPFSPACDYMATCNYNCRPDATIDEKSLNEDTYDENFIVINSEKILQRIRMLFKESFFYKKNMLLKAIQTPKEYPYIQIYSALTQLIEDENEFIVDKYGRNGRLINIGEYYLFQPIELINKNISIYDRTVPLDYKHNMINFELKQNIVKPVIDKRNIDKIEIDGEEKEKEEMTFQEGKKIIKEMIINYNITIEFTKKNKVPRSDDNWYKHYGIVSKKISKEYPETKQYLILFMVAHMIELLLFQHKVHLMNYIYSLESIKTDSLESYIKEYFDSNTIVTKKFTAIILYNLDKRIIMILDENNKWIKATPEDQREIALSKESKEFLAFNLDDYNTIIGFIGYEKGNKDLAFKTKNMTSKRDTGARCDQASKNINLTKLNEILGENKYTIENTKAIKDKDGNIIQETMGNTEICVLKEVILRYFNITERNNKKWFLTPEMAIYHKLYTIFV
jgi:ferredoxin